MTVTNAPDLHALFETLGEVKIIAREAKHAAHQTSMKVDGVAAKVDALALVVAQQGELRTNHDRLERRQDSADLRIDALEADKHRREGAIGLFEWISKHWPFTVLGALIIGFVAWANGKVDL